MHRIPAGQINYVALVGPDHRPKEGTLRLDKGGESVNNRHRLITKYQGVTVTEVSELKIGRRSITKDNLTRYTVKNEERILKFLRAALEPSVARLKNSGLKSAFKKVIDHDKITTPKEFLKKLYDAKALMGAADFVGGGKKADVETLNEVNRQFHIIFKWIGHKLRKSPSLYRRFFGENPREYGIKYSQDKKIEDVRGRRLVKGQNLTTGDAGAFLDALRYGEAVIMIESKHYDALPGRYVRYSQFNWDKREVHKAFNENAGDAVKVLKKYERKFKVEKKKIGKKLKPKNIFSRIQESKKVIKIDKKLDKLYEKIAQWKGKLRINKKARSVQLKIIKTRLLNRKTKDKAKGELRKLEKKMRSLTRQRRDYIEEYTDLEMNLDILGSAKGYRKTKPRLELARAEEIHRDRKALIAKESRKQERMAKKSLRRLRDRKAQRARLWDRPDVGEKMPVSESFREELEGERRADAIRYGGACLKSYGEAIEDMEELIANPVDTAEYDEELAVGLKAVIEAKVVLDGLQSGVKLQLERNVVPLERKVTSILQAVGVRVTPTVDIVGEQLVARIKLLEEFCQAPQMDALPRKKAKFEKRMEEYKQAKVAQERKETKVIDNYNTAFNRLVTETEEFNGANGLLKIFEGYQHADAEVKRRLEARLATKITALIQYYNDANTRESELDAVADAQDVLEEDKLQALSQDRSGVPVEFEYEVLRKINEEIIVKCSKDDSSLTTREAQKQRIDLLNSFIALYDAIYDLDVVPNVIDDFRTRILDLAEKVDEEYKETILRVVAEMPEALEVSEESLKSDEPERRKEETTKISARFKFLESLVAKYQSKFIKDGKYRELVARFNQVKAQFDKVSEEDKENQDFDKFFKSVNDDVAALKNQVEAMQVKFDAYKTNQALAQTLTLDFSHTISGLDKGYSKIEEDYGYVNETVSHFEDINLNYFNMFERRRKILQDSMTKLSWDIDLFRGSILLLAESAEMNKLKEILPVVVRKMPALNIEANRLPSGRFRPEYLKRISKRIDLLQLIREKYEQEYGAEVLEDNEDENYEAITVEQTSLRTKFGNIWASQFDRLGLSVTDEMTAEYTSEQDPKDWVRKFSNYKDAEEMNRDLETEFATSINTMGAYYKKLEYVLARLEKQKEIFKNMIPERLQWLETYFNNLRVERDKVKAYLAETVDAKIIKPELAQLTMVLADDQEKEIRIKLYEEIIKFYELIYPEELEDEGSDQAKAVNEYERKVLELKATEDEESEGEMTDDEMEALSDTSA